jgi:PKD repeat protein
MIRPINLIFCVFFLLIGNFYAQNSVTSIPNLRIWLRADTGLVLNGTEVTQWSDLSGNNNHFNSPLTTTRPSLVSSSSLNNRPFILFNGTKRLETASTLSFGNTTIFIVAENNTGDPSFGRIIDHVYNTGFWIGRGTSNNLGGGFFEGAAPYGNFVAMNLNVPFALSLSRTGATTSYYKGSEFFTTPTRTTISSSTVANKVMLGASVLGGDNGNKDIYEVIIYNRALDPIEIAQVHEYLRQRYSSNSVSLGPDITITGLFCPTTLIPSSGFTNYFWNNSTTGATFSATQNGSYTVRATDALGFYSYDTILVTYPTIPSPVNTGICAGQANTWNADMGVGFTYLWSNGQTTPALNITTPGDYFVKVTDQFGCFKYSDTLTFTLDNYSLTANLGPDTNLCSGNFIALQSGAGETVSYIWPDGTTGNQYAVDTTGSYFVEAVNVNGCVARDTVHINVIGVAPLAEFTTANVCDGVNAVFTDNSVPVGTAPIDGWAWDFGDTTSATTQSPTHTYAAPGTYIVELFVSQGGCGAFHYDTVTVYQNPQALFTFSGHCQGQPVQFNNASTIGNAPLITYSWDFDMPWTGAYNTSTIPIPYREFDSIGVFDVQFTVTDANGCADSVTIPVLIDPSPEVVFTMPDGCVNQSISAQFTGLTQNPSTYLWDFGDNAFSILNNPSHNFSVYGEYTVSLSVTNAFNCTVVGQDQIDVFAVPVPSFDLGPYCKGTYVEMTNTSTIAQDSVTQTTWVINTTDTISGNPGFYLIPELGQQQIEVIATSNEGCSSSTFEFIEVEDSLNVSFSVGTGIAAVGEPFPFTNTTTGTNLALWNFGDQTFSSEFSPDHTYGEALTDSILQVYLIGLNASGCIDTAFQNVIVRPSELDLALETLFLQENGTFDFLGVKMNNAGTVRVKKVVFEVLSDKGPLVQETWTGNLLPTEDTIYVFQSQPSLQFSLEDEKEAFVCVRSIAYDWQNQAETLLQNNDRCLNLEGDGVILTTLAPNPASNEVGFQLLVTKSSVISAELIDMNGKRARLLIPSTTVEPGIVEFKADVRTIENGVYFLQFNCNGTTTTQRLVILQ